MKALGNIILIGLVSFAIVAAGMAFLVLI